MAISRFIKLIFVGLFAQKTSLFELHRPQHLASPSFDAAPFVAPPRNDPLACDWPAAQCMQNADMRKAQGFAVKNEVQPLNLSFFRED